eukprot:EG_transcript_8171
MGGYFLIPILIPAAPPDASLSTPEPRPVATVAVESPPPSQPIPPPALLSPLPLTCASADCHASATAPVIAVSPAPQPIPTHPEQGGRTADARPGHASPPTPAALPHRPIPRGTPPVRCRSVTHHPPLPTQLCYAGEAAGCLGELRVQRSACPPFPPEVAREGGLAAEIHAWGPDAFRVRWEGPEVVMVAMQHVGNCRYEGSFAFSLPGEYELQAFTMFENFHGHADHPYARPAYVPNALVTPDARKVRCARPRHAWRPPATLPRCDTLQAPGRWVRAPEGGPGRAGRAVGGWPARWLKSGVVFARRWGADMQWQPYHCHYSNYSQDDLVRALAGKRIAFIGDSQTRSLFYPVVNAIHQNKVLGNPKIVDQNPNHQGWIEFAVRGNITVRYFVDNFLADARSANSLTWHSLIRGAAHDWDLLVAGMGNWAMCGNLARQGIGLWSLHKYRREIDRIAKQLQEYSRRTGTRVIWHNQPDFPWEMDPYRNGARLRLFNRYATDRMVSLGLEVFDAFNVSSGMLHTAVGWPLGHFNDYHVR